MFVPKTPEARSGFLRPVGLHPSRRGEPARVDPPEFPDSRFAKSGAYYTSYQYHAKYVIHKYFNTNINILTDRAPSRRARPRRAGHQHHACWGQPRRVAVLMHITHIYIYIYIYREREIYIYIYIYMWWARHRGCRQGRAGALGFVGDSLAGRARYITLTLNVTVYVTYQYITS